MKTVFTIVIKFLIRKIISTFLTFNYEDSSKVTLHFFSNAKFNAVGKNQKVNFKFLININIKSSF